MQNFIPAELPEGQPLGNRASRSVTRALEGRRAVYEDEVRRLLEASFALIRETGCLEPRVSEIVGAAGLSNQSFYRHFRSKDELLLAVLDEGVAILAGYLSHRMEAEHTPEARIRAWVAGVLEQALQPEAAAAARPFAVSRARLAELFPAEVADSERRITGMLRDAIAEAEFPGSDPERDAATLYDLAMGWVQRQLAGGKPARRADAEHLTAFALNGLLHGAEG